MASRDLSSTTQNLCVSSTPASPCIVSLTTSQDVVQVGQTAEITFMCRPGGGARTFGCFDVAYSANDATTGDEATFSAVNCGGPGSAGQPPKGCQACPVPPEDSHVTAEGQCTGLPAGGLCPAGFVTIVNAGGGAEACQGPSFQTIKLSLSSGAPHDFLVMVTGHVGADSSGACPDGTTLDPQAPNPQGATGFSCKFSLVIQQEFAEVNRIEFIPVANCGGGLSPIGSTIGGSPCIFRVRAWGITVVKLNVDCSQESIPTPTVTPVPTAVTPREPKESSLDEVGESTQAGNITEQQEGALEGGDSTPPPPAPYYQCTDNALRIVRVVPNVRITLRAQNGFFPAESNCQPANYSSSGAPPAVQTPTPSPTPTPTASPTPAPGTAIPPTGTTAGVCPTGSIQSLSTSIVVTTGPNGVSPIVPGELEAAAIPSDSPACGYEPFFPSPVSGNSVYICGALFQDDTGSPGAKMFTTFYYTSPPPNDQNPCHDLSDRTNLSPSTDPFGRAICVADNVFANDLDLGEDPNEEATETPAIENAEEAAESNATELAEYDTAHSFTASDEVVVQVTFELPGLLAGNFCSTSTSFIRNGPPPSPNPDLVVTSHCDTSQVGIAVAPLGVGPVSVTAIVPSIVDSQPEIQTTMTLGSFGISTPTPTETPVASATPSVTATPTNTPTPTNIPTASPTATPLPSTPTPLPTSTPTPTATPTATKIPVLSFTFDAARVAKVGDKGDRRGLDEVHPGSKVRLMDYYTIRSMPGPLQRVTTYRVVRGAKTVVDAVFKGTEPAKDVGQWVRYVDVKFPNGAPFGVYTFVATLKLGNESKTRSWRFAVARNVYVAP